MNAFSINILFQNNNGWYIVDSRDVSTNTEITMRSLFSGLKLTKEEEQVLKGEKIEEGDQEGEKVGGDVEGEKIVGAGAAGDSQVQTDFR